MGHTRGPNGRRSAAALVGLCALLVSVLQAAPAFASPALTIQPITWNVLGMDTNNVNVGPDTFPVGVRVCNSGDATATNMISTFVWDTSATYINLTGPATLSASSLAPSACADFYFQVVITRNVAAFATARRYHITAVATGVSAVSTPTPRELYVARLHRENPNDHVVTFTGPTTVYVGQTYTYQLSAWTATNRWQLEAALIMPNTMFQVISVAETYSTPSGATNSKIYADACGWDNDPTHATTYRKCVGPPNYPGGKVGGNITGTFTVKILSSGTASIAALLSYYDGDYHYNTDYGTGINNISVTAEGSADLSLAKTHAAPFIVGSQGTYTISVSNAGPDDAAGSLSVTDSLPAGLAFVSGSGSGWTCAAAGQAVTCTNPSALASGASTSFPVTVSVGAGAVPQVTNQATVSSPTFDPALSNNTGQDVTPVDRPPVAVNDSAATSKGVPVTINVLANDSDPDGDPLTVTVLIPPGNGSAAVNPDETITYTPGAGFTGTDSFGYHACDVSSACGTAGISVLVPTAVAFEGGAAFLRPDGAHVAWHTGLEVGNLGFDVYRQDGGSRLKLTPTPLAGSALVVGPTAPVTGDRSYGFVDPQGRSGARYWVRDLDVSGRSTWHGPYAVRSTPPAWAASARPAAPLGELGRTGGSSSALRVAHVGSEGRRDGPVGSGPSIHSPAVEIMVDHEGWYRVPLATLAGLGVDTRNPSRLRVWAEGKEQAVEITGDALEFYGLGLDTPSTGARVYWVSAGGSSGARVPVVDGSAEGPPAGDSFTATVTRRDRLVYFASLLNGDADNFFGGLVFPAPTTETLDVPELFTADGALLEVSVQGVTAGAHSVEVDLNGVALGSLSFDRQALGDATFPAPGLVDGSNDVTLTSGSAGDYGLVGTISVTYQRRYAATDDALRFTVAGGTRVAVTGFSDPAVRLVDATNPAAPVEVTPVVSADGDTYTATATIPGTGTRTLYAFASGRVDAPSSVVADQASSLRASGNAADLVIITTADLAPSVAPLAVLREQQGLKVDVVDVQDVYDEFSFGEKDPAAIHAFLALAAAKWATPPRYVLLFGDGTYDPRGWLGGSPDLVPTKLVDTTFMETASDNWFADTNGDGQPDLALGRIPAVDAAGASAIVAKLVAYDGSSAPASAVLGADQPDMYDFPAAVAQLAAGLPDGVGETDLVRPASGNADLVGAIASGPTLVSYLGHGNVDSWAGGWLSDADAASLSNSGHPALFVSMTCLNGYFTDPYLPALGESLLGAPGGAVAVWASTGLGDPASELAMSQALLGQLFDPTAPGSLAPVRLGDAVSAAQRASTSREAVVTAELLGDPTTYLR